MVSARLLVAFLVVVTLESESCGVRGVDVLVRLGSQSLPAFALKQAASKWHRGGPTDDDNGLEIRRATFQGLDA